jgi:maleate isomerase
MGLPQSRSIESAVCSQSWTPEFDAGRNWRARLGFVLISNDATIEDDMHKMAPAGVGLHFTRASMPNECTVANLATMERGLAKAAANLLPGFEVNVVCYACTSGSAVIGEERVVAELLRPFPERKATTLLTGVIEGLRALGTRRIVLGTPYLDEINTLEAVYLRDKGFDVLNAQGMNLTYDTDMVRVTPNYLAEFARAIDDPEAEAIFISCGALRTIDAIETIEQATGKPVVSSNQGMLWHCLRLAGIADKVPGYGRLFVEH